MGLVDRLRGLLRGGVKADAVPGVVDVPEAPDDLASGAVPSRAVTSSAHSGAFDVGWMTDTGLVRDHNEDSLLVFSGQQDGDRPVPAFGIFMLADGMGGHRDGEAASSLALRVCAGQVISQVYLPTLNGGDRAANQPALADIVRDAVAHANRCVAQSYPGSGSTLTYGMLLGTRLFIGHVGDSRAYLLREGDSPKLLTQDHSFVGRLVEMGQLTLAEAAVHPQRNVLYRAIGQPEDLEVDVATCLLRSGDRLLFCSDGLWNMVDEASIWAIVDQGGSPQEICGRLVGAANDAGGYDNVTVILVDLHLE